MIKDPVYISEDKSAYEAISLMKEKRVDMLYLLDKNKVLKGAVGIYDLGKGGRNIKDLREIMTRPYYIKKDAKIMDAINQILELDIKNLAVVDDSHHLLGIVTRASVVDTIYNNLWGDSLVGDDD